MGPFYVCINSWTLNIPDLSCLPLLLVHHFLKTEGKWLELKIMPLVGGSLKPEHSWGSDVLVMEKSMGRHLKLTQYSSMNSSPGVTIMTSAGKKRMRANEM